MIMECAIFGNVAFLHSHDIIFLSDATHQLYTSVKTKCFSDNSIQVWKSV